MTKDKRYFFYYLKENVLIFDISCYIDELAVHVIDFYYDWDLLKKENNRFYVNSNPKLIKELLETKIKKEILEFKNIAQTNDCKILSYFSVNIEPKEWKKYFSDPLKFIKTCKRICKKHLPNFYETVVDEKLFSKRKGEFLGFSCIIPSGEDDEFIIKALDKLKK